MMMQLSLQFKQLERRSLKKSVQIWIISYILHIMSLLAGDMNSIDKLTSLAMCGFIAQFVEHRTGFRRGHEFEPWFFFRLLLSNCLNWKINCDCLSSLSSYLINQKTCLNWRSICSSKTGARITATEKSDEENFFGSDLAVCMQCQSGLIGQVLNLLA